MVHRVQVRPISSDEGNKLLRIVRRSSGSVVTWRRAQMVLLSAQGMAVPQIAEVTETSGPTREELRTLVTGFSHLASRLGQVPTAVRAEIHAALGVRITYDPSTSSVEAEVSPSNEMLRKTSVRGGV
jgi:hypothetical protein